MSQNNHSKIIDPFDPTNDHLLQQQALALEEEIELTIFNYEALLEMERKNSADRSEFLLFLIQSTKNRQHEELQALKAQLEAAVAEKEEAHNLQKQMETIGEGVDSIVEEGKKLKTQNESLQQQFQEQQSREKQLDQELQSCQSELESYRQRIDEWERTKIKWNRRKKELIEIISDAQKQVSAGKLESMNEEEAELQEEPLSGLYTKYKGTTSH